MTTYSREDIDNFPQRYRTTFINSLSGFRTACLIGTADKNGKSNLAIFNSLTHIGAHPPLLGLIIRPHSAERHTLENILDTNVFTINHVQESFLKKAHQTSARYPQEISEFEATGLNEYYADAFYAPFVAESTVRIAAKHLQTIDITANNTILLIAEIIRVELPDPIVRSDGYIDLGAAGTIVCNGLDSYHTTQPIARLTYAKPDTEPDYL